MGNGMLPDRATTGGRAAQMPRESATTSTVRDPNVAHLVAKRDDLVSICGAHLLGIASESAKRCPVCIALVDLRHKWQNGEKRG